MTQPMLDEWETILSLLPANWEQLAHQYEQVETKYGNAKITNAADLLRLILVHAAADMPLRQTVALVAQAGGPSISPMRLHKKMVRAADYLHALVTSMVDAPMGLSPERWAGYTATAVDATVICRPGSLFGDARIHHRMRLSDLKYLQVRSTAIDEGETLCGFSFEPGELVIGDRGYCNARGLAHVVDAGADVLIRLNRTSMPMLALDEKTSIDIMTVLRELPSRGVHQRLVCVPYKCGRDTRLLQGRLCIMRLPEHEARKARERARKEQGADVSDDTLEAASYVVLFTTTPWQRLSAAQCIELYRLRWQVELQFKRWKSICGLDRMPNFRPDTIASWLYAKILAAVLLDKLTSLQSEVFPPIDCDYEEDHLLDHALADGEATLEADPVALAAVRLRALADQALRADTERRAADRPTRRPRPRNTTTSARPLPRTTQNNWRPSARTQRSHVR